MRLLGGQLTNNQNPYEWIDIDFSSEDWAEAVSLYAPSQLAMGRKRSHATLTGYIPFARISGAVKYFLGFSWVDGGNFLRRQVPATHPIFPTLFATEITECVGVKFVAKAAKPHKWSLPYATYSLARITVGYSQPPYEILSDADLDMTSAEAYRGQELRRWVNWSPKPYVDLLELPGGMFVFDAPGEAFNDRPLILPRHVYRAEKQTRRVVWHNVPIEFVTDDYGYMPKIDAAIGRVSSDVFFGDPTGPIGSPGRPGTWLLEDVDTVNNEVYADPIASAVFEGMTRRLDLIFTFKHFNPPNGRTDGDTTAGWALNLAANGKWYPAKNSVTGAKQDFPAQTSFLKLFTHWSD